MSAFNAITRELRAGESSKALRCFNNFGAEKQDCIRYYGNKNPPLDFIFIVYDVCQYSKYNNKREYL